MTGQVSKDGDVGIKISDLGFKFSVHNTQIHRPGKTITKKRPVAGPVRHESWM